MTNKKRLAIYVFYDIHGIADNYQFVLLNDLKQNIDKLLIVINGKITDDSLKKLKEIADDVLIRENKGLDTMAYKEGLAFYNEKELSSFYEIVMLNDTIYGPFYPFSEMFNAMDKKEVLDFWGITIHAKTDTDPFGRLKCGYIPRHIQSYFIVVRNTMFTSNSFKQYWNDMDGIETYLDAVCKHEVMFTKNFEDLGFKWSIYIDSPKITTKIDHYLFYYGKELVEKYRCPIIKKRVFFNKYEDIYPVSFGQSAYELFQYVKTKTEYDENLILENLIRTKNQYDLYRNLKLSYILPSDISKLNGKKPFNKVALVMHIYFPDLIEYCLEYAKSMPEYTDIFITTDKESIKRDVLNKMDTLKCKHFEVRLIPNRGRSESAILIAVRDIIMDYEVVCFVHDKKTSQIKPSLIGESFSYQCFENTLGSKDYVENILDIFDKDKHIGILTPTPPNASAFYCTLGVMEWGANFEVTEKLLDDLNIKVPLDETRPPMAPLGGMFWFRPKALKALYDRNYQYEDFPMEMIETDGTMLHAIERAYPFVAQYHGYYTAYVTKDTYANLDLINLSYYASRLNTVLIDKYGFLSFEHLIVSINGGSIFARIKNKFKVFVVRTFPKSFVRFCKKVLRLR